MTCLRLLSRHVCPVFATCQRKLGSKINKRIFQSSFKQCSSTIQVLIKHYSAYEGDGKIVAFVLNKKGRGKMVCVDSITLDGFILSNGADVIGSTILFPHSLLSWHVQTASQVTEDSLELFKLLDPKIDLLVFGYGTPKDYTAEVRENFTSICKKLGMRYEALPTVQAAGLYNFLAIDMRYVAAALIPPTVINPIRVEKSKYDLLELDKPEPDEKELENIKKLEILRKNSELKQLK